MTELESQLQRSGLQIVGCCEQLSSRGAALLAHSPLLEDMSPDEADTLGAAMLRVHAVKGQTLIREGESGDWMMLVLQGTVDVTKQALLRPEIELSDILAERRTDGDDPGAGIPAGEAAPAPHVEAPALSGISRVAVLRPGAAIGEMSMLDGGLRYASCTALDEVEAGVLGRREIALLIRDHPTVGAKLLVKITQLMAQRLRNTSDHLVRLLQKS
jgi:CRP/FNR family transcriptional regulator, cyclic AMP receptor protein